VSTSTARVLYGVEGQRMSKGAASLRDIFVGRNSSPLIHNARAVLYESHPVCRSRPRPRSSTQLAARPQVQAPLGHELLGVLKGSCVSALLACLGSRQHLGGGGPTGSGGLGRDEAVCKKRVLE
jgi:hypothetical protein